MFSLKKNYFPTLTKDEYHYLLSSYFKKYLQLIEKYPKIFLHDIAKLAFFKYANAIGAADILKEDKISEFKIALIKDTIINLSIEEIKNPTKHNDINDKKSSNSLRAYEQFYKFSHLAILSVFENKEKLGKKKRQKLLYLIANPNIAQRAIRIYNYDITSIKEKKIESKTSENDFPNYNLNFIPDFERQHYGMFDRHMDLYVDLTLKKTGYAELIITKNNSVILELTKKGIDYISKIKAEPEFQEFCAICKRLKECFDNMSGTELEHYLKEKVVPDWDQRNFGERI